MVTIDTSGLIKSRAFYIPGRERPQWKKDIKTQEKGTLRLSGNVLLREPKSCSSLARSPGHKTVRLRSECLNMIAKAVKLARIQPEQLQSSSPSTPLQRVHAKSPPTPTCSPSPFHPFPFAPPLPHPPQTPRQHYLLANHPTLWLAKVNVWRRLNPTSSSPKLLMEPNEIRPLAGRQSTRPLRLPSELNVFDGEAHTIANVLGPLRLLKKMSLIVGMRIF